MFQQANLYNETEFLCCSPRVFYQIKFFLPECYGIFEGEILQELHNEK